MQPTLEPAAAARQPCQPTAAEHAWHIPFLVSRDALNVCDADGKEDFAAWVKQCPIAATNSQAAATPCLIQRREVRDVMVLTPTGSVVLSVRRLACLSHQRTRCSDRISFFITHPAVFPQLLKQGLRMMPDIFVLNAQTIVTREAYMCAFLHYLVTAKNAFFAGAWPSPIVVHEHQ